MSVKLTLTSRIEFIEVVCAYGDIRAFIISQECKVYARKTGTGIFPRRGNASHANNTASLRPSFPFLEEFDGRGRNGIVEDGTPSIPWRISKGRCGAARHAPTVLHDTGFSIQNFDIGIFGVNDMRTFFNNIHANFFPFHQNMPVECGLDRLF